MFPGVHFTFFHFTFFHFTFFHFFINQGGLAQLARALDLHSRGQGFDSLILHSK